MIFGSRKTEREKIDELVEKSQNGDSKAFGELYEQFIDKIFRFVFFRVGRREVAEDLTQTVFLKALEHIKGFRKESQFSSWLFTIARNSIIDYYRSRKPVYSLGEFDELVAKDNTQDYESKEILVETLNAIRRLKEEEQEVIILHSVEEYSFEEIARITKKSPGALRILKHRALRKLKTDLKK